MRHGVGGRKLSRTIDERRRLFLILTRFLFLHGSLKTTLAKAKAIQPMVEKLITKAKKGDNASLNQIHKKLADKPTVETLLEWAKTRFSKRSSGFTRIMKLGMRVGDGGEEVMLTFVDELPVVETVKSVKISKDEIKVQEATVVSTKKPKSPKSKKV